MKIRFGKWGIKTLDERYIGLIEYSINRKGEEVYKVKECYHSIETLLRELFSKIIKTSDADTVTLLIKRIESAENVIMELAKQCKEQQDESATETAN